MMESVSRLYLRLLLVIGRGRIALVDDSGPVQYLQVNFGTKAEPIIVNAPSPMLFGFTSNPPADSDAFMAFIGGDRANGYAAATNSQTARLRNLQPGEAALYDAQGRYVKLGASGVEVFANGAPVDVSGASDVTVTASGSISLTAGTGISLTAPTIQLNGAVVTSSTLATAGSITDLTGSGNADTVGDLRGAYNGHKHPVVNVQAGGSTITSGTTDSPV